MQVSAFTVVGEIADRILVDDLPQLPDDRRHLVVQFIAKRIDVMPGVTRAGVLIIGAALRVLSTVPGGWRVARALMRLPIPLVGEFPRLVRSLAVAYIWETWPASLPSGAPG